MKIDVFDSVVVVRNLPEHGLLRGDLGAVVDIYDPDSLEVEFVLPTGKTRAVVKLDESDVRLATKSQYPSDGRSATGD